MMTDGILTDAQIAALTPEQRRDLIIRLEQPLSDVIDPVLLSRIRRIRLGLMIGGAIAMIPWLVYLAMTLPGNYVAGIPFIGTPEDFGTLTPAVDLSRVCIVVACGTPMTRPTMIARFQKTGEMAGTVNSS